MRVQITDRGQINMYKILEEKKEISTYIILSFNLINHFKKE